MNVLNRLSIMRLFLLLALAAPLAAQPNGYPTSGSYTVVGAGRDPETGPVTTSLTLPGRIGDNNTIVSGTLTIAGTPGAQTFDLHCIVRANDNTTTADTHITGTVRPSTGNLWVFEVTASGNTWYFTKKDATTFYLLPGSRGRIQLGPPT